MHFGELAGEAVSVFGEDAETVHAGVHLELNGDIFLAQLRGGGFVRKKLLATVNCGSEVVLQEIFFLAGPEATEDEDGRANAGLANFDALTGRGDTEPIRAGLFEGLGDRGATVAIAIAFDDRENFARSFAFFRRRIDVVANVVKISGERRERNFGPDGAAHEIGGIRILFGARHELS